MDAELLAARYAILAAGLEASPSPDEAGDYQPTPALPIWPEDLAICSQSAQLLAERLGGLVHGYFAPDNPTALVVRLEGGHDFVVVAERYLVDWWRTASGSEPLELETPAVLDLAEPTQAALARTLYGPAACWTPA